MSSTPRLIDGDDPRILLVCDHASNAVPAGLDLGVPAEALSQHVAWDIGAEAVSRTVAATLACRAWLASVSRLVVDCNRPPEQAIPQHSDGIPISGNANLSATDTAARLALHHAFHDGLARQIQLRPPQLLVSIHSFTPALASAPAPRPWPIAILWNQDYRATEYALAALEAEPDLGGPIGANEPYSGQILNYTMDRHAEAIGLPYLGFEIRQDLIANAPGVARWSAIVARTIRATQEGLCSAS
ncbi:N-formylglutamate amidohydrolase [Sandaracinobacter neustonicus]|uniref:N-formylglutamate amidohydrolase n=1 Tax=Sandaracinobacter neustonicus TaxID=1715348 RepID=A0A501XEC9_9SPHN|nr:N-formylglutamate amidohydrolase [Sandaracinobacter neustonicus]TPE58654.1 N-formylglutamate amidohydrolase [Sandaracinobacter neustonicus]